MVTADTDLTQVRINNDWLIFSERFEKILKFVAIGKLSIAYLSISEEKMLHAQASACLITSKHAWLKSMPTFSAPIWQLYDFYYFLSIIAIFEQRHSNKNEENISQN